MSVLTRKLDAAEAQEHVDDMLARALVRVDQADLEGGQKHHRKFDDEAKLVFLLCLSRCGLINHSAAAAGVHPTTITDHRQKDEQFDNAVDQALGYFRDRVEAEAIRRAIDGVEVPEFYKGQVVGTKTQYSDRLLEKIMNRYIPEYRDAAAAEISLNAGVLVVNRPQSDPDEWAEEFNTKKIGEGEENES